MTFGFRFRSVRYGIRFSLVRAHCLLLSLCSVLGKTSVLIQFVLAGLWFFPISSFIGDP